MDTKNAQISLTVKYFDVFPMLLKGISSSTHTTKENYAGHCYSFRTFDRFLSFFGLVKIEQERGMDAEKYILKGDVFDGMIVYVPHKNHLK